MSRVVHYHAALFQCLANKKQSTAFEFKTVISGLLLRGGPAVSNDHIYELTAVNDPALKLIAEIVEYIDNNICIVKLLQEDRSKGWVDTAWDSLVNEREALSKAEQEFMEINEKMVKLKLESADDETNTPLLALNNAEKEFNIAYNKLELERNNYIHNNDFYLVDTSS